MRRPATLPFVALFALAGCGGVIESGTPTTDGGPRPMPDLARPRGDAATSPGGDGGTIFGDTVVTIGQGGSAFDPRESGSSGVKTDGKGGLVLDPGNYGTSTTPIIWVANSSEGTVSKIETRTLKEVARYRTGPGSPDPSRTTVGLSGDVVVANRGGSSATKIAADQVRCADKNGNGRIDTSTGGGDVKPWGQDECVLWHTPFAPGQLARAAAFDAQIGVDGDDSSTVWIGLYGAMQMKQLDSKTGKELATIDVSPVRPYGAAIDKDGNVWVRGGKLVRIDKQHKVTMFPESQCGYGIAVDPLGRVWTSGSNCVARFDPATQQWKSNQAGSGFNRGLAVDAKGSVWVADTSFGVHQLDMNTLAVKKDLGIGLSNFVGMAIDFDGMIWAISQGNSKAVRIDPNTYQTQQVQVGNGPYTYSDMTGFQLRNAAAPFGKWRHTFAGCGKETSFEQIAWQATVPVGTSVTVKARTGADLTSLGAADWVLLAKSPPDKSPVAIGAKLGKPAALMEVEITLQSVSADTTPILQSIAVKMSCIPGIG